MSDDIVRKFDALKRRYNSFANDVKLESITREISNISEKITKLPSDIQAIRDRKYVFSAYLEQKAGVIQNHWDEILQQLNQSLTDEAEKLRNALTGIEQDMERAEKVSSTPEKLDRVLPQLESAVSGLEGTIREVSNRLRDLYRATQTEISQTENQLRKINWYCEQLEEASFSLPTGESLFLAADAEWQEDKKNKPNGIIYLTDQRLIFEQKEVTGKRLGLFGGSKEQDVKWAIELDKIESVKPENKGMLGNIDLLHFQLGSGAPHAALTVEVKGGIDCKFWAKQIDRMIAGETQDERAIPPDAEMLEAIRNAPTECHVCGATLPKLITNQTQIDCEYCGSTIRI